MVQGGGTGRQVQAVHVSGNHIDVFDIGVVYSSVYLMFARIIITFLFIITLSFLNFTAPLDEG